MTTDKHLEFIKNRIHDSGQAMVYRYIDESHKQPMGIKKSLVMDEAGQLYFSMENNFEQKFNDDVFPVELFFYKKGNAFYMTAKGVAINVSKQVNALQGMDNLKEGNVIRIQMDEVEYSELPGLVHDTLWTKCLKFFGNIQASFL